MSDYLSDIEEVGRMQHAEYLQLQAEARVRDYEAKYAYARLHGKIAF